MLTREECLQKACEQLRASEVENVWRESRLLLAYVLQCKETEIIAWPSVLVTEDQRVSFMECIKRRCQREPISRIMGVRGFWDFDVKINSFVLDPRPETELIIDLCCGMLDETGTYTILDAGTGSGCILIALLRLFPQSSGVGVDISSEALSIARDNARCLGVEDRAFFLRSCWLEGLDNKRFDVIVSNPPYICTGDLEQLDQEVSYDPRLALDGGADGLVCYRSLLKDLKRIMNPGGIVLFEIGEMMGDALSRLIFDCLGMTVKIFKDLAGKDRVLLFGGHGTLWT